jgi:hypothetical protein
MILSQSLSWDRFESVCLPLGIGGSTDLLVADDSH